MAVQGTVKDFVGFSNKVGFFLGRPIAICPSLEEMSKFKSIDNIKEDSFILKYEDVYNDKQDKEHRKANIVVYFMTHDEQTILSKTFSIIDIVSTSTKDGITKKQYINQIGNTTWATDLEALKDSKFSFFTKWGMDSIRECKWGEAAFYEFMQKWLSLDWTDPNTDLSFDMEKIFKGNFKELKDVVKNKTFADNKVVGYATIRTKIILPTEENPEPDNKYYQDVYNVFLPKSAWDFIHTEKGLPKTFPSFIDKYIKGMGEGYSKCKDYYGVFTNGKTQVTEMRDFDINEAPTSQGSSLHTEMAGVTETVDSNGQVNGLNPEGVDDLPF